MKMYEYVCDHLVPGCTTRIKDETKERVAPQASEHVEDRHDADPIGDHLNDEIWQAIVRLHG